MKKFSNSNGLKANNLIQPIFIDEGLKSKKIIKGLGANYSHTIQSAKQTIASDIKKGVKKILKTVSMLGTVIKLQICLQSLALL